MQSTTIFFAIAANGFSIGALLIALSNHRQRTNRESALIAEVERLRSDRERLQGAVELMLERLPEPPEPNCSCFISPPCNDCIDYAGERESFEYARLVLANSMADRP